MLGAVRPSCGSVYGCLSNRSPQEKVHRDNISLGRDQWTTAECRILLTSSSLHALFVLISFMILLVVNSFTLSVTHGTDIIIPGNLFFCSLLKFFVVSYLEITAVIPYPGNFSVSAPTGSEVIKVNGHI